jgi:hypothetical protein
MEKKKKQGIPGFNPAVPFGSERGQTPADAGGGTEDPPGIKTPERYVRPTFWQCGQAWVLLRGTRRTSGYEKAQRDPFRVSSATDGRTCGSGQVGQMH